MTCLSFLRWGRISINQKTTKIRIRGRNVVARAATGLTCATSPSAPATAAVSSGILEQARVSYLGPAGTYTEEAAKYFFKDTNSFIPKKTVDEAIEEVKSGQADYAVIPQDNTFTVSCSSRLLRKLDSSGKVIDGDPVSSLEFTNTGSFMVSSEEPIKSWSVNGIRFEPAEPINELKIMNSK